MLAVIALTALIAFFACVTANVLGPLNKKLDRPDLEASGAFQPSEVAL